MLEVDSVDNFFNDRLFSLNKKYLSTIGCWPFQNLYHRNIIMFIIWIGIFSVFIPEVIYFIEVFYITHEMIQCLMALILTYGVFVMYFNCTLRFDKMIEILSGFQRNWKSLKSLDELYIFRRFAEEGRFLILLFSGAASMSLIVFMTLPLLPKLLDQLMPKNESRPTKPLLLTEYFIDTSNHYWLVYLHHSQAAFSVILIAVSMDSYFVMIIQNAISMFAVLGYRMNQVDQEYAKISYYYSETDKDNFMYRKIVECIDYHRECIRFTNLIEEVFTISFFLQIFLNVLLISVLSVQVITFKDDIELMLSFTFNTCSIILRLFYVSWCGQKVLDSSSDVHKYLCNLNWYNWPIKSKKLIRLMLLRSLKPCKITAGKILPLNFQTYCKLMQTSMSYFTMILSAQHAK